MLISAIRHRKIQDRRLSYWGDWRGKAVAGEEVDAEPRRRLISSEIEDNFGWSSQVFGIDTGLV